MDTQTAGRKGGLKTLEIYGKEHFRRIRRIIKKGRPIKKIIVKK